MTGEISPRPVPGQDITREEFMKRVGEADYAPGWDAVTAAFDELYPGQTPSHYATDIAKRALFGGEQYLDGYSVYRSPKGYMHIVTYGMTILYADPDEFGGEYSGWGYEMTMKLPGNSMENCRWAINVLAKLARYTYTEKRWFEPYDHIRCGRISPGSELAGFLAVPDTEAVPRVSVYGRVDLMQLVGLTGRELTALETGECTAADLTAAMTAAGSPDLLTDPARKNSYI